tara:strand:- start:8 stop:235 length:228 start_codon:yes stop_codon:yes gene_type:complete
MINEILHMNGYGLYVWSAFLFTLLSLFSLYVITKVQYVREKNRFLSKFDALDSRRADAARLQTINREILSSSQTI